MSLDDALVVGGALLEVVHGGGVTYEGRDEMSLRSPVAHQRESDAAVGCGVMTIRREAVSAVSDIRCVAILGESERPAEDRIRKVGHLVESAGDAGETVALAEAVGGGADSLCGAFCACRAIQGSHGKALARTFPCSGPVKKLTLFGTFRLTGPGSDSSSDRCRVESRQLILHPICPRSEAPKFVQQAMEGV